MATERHKLCACGLLFVPNSHTQKRCNACRFPQVKGVPGPHRFCVRCGVVFTPKGSRDVYCSETCREASPAPLKPCVQCGASFSPTTNQRYCTACQKTATARARQRLRLPDRACVMCGVRFTPKRQAHAVCSPACKQRLWWSRQAPEQKRRASLARVLRKHEKAKP